jgi:hypothetical protein
MRVLPFALLATVFFAGCGGSNASESATSGPNATALRVCGELAAILDEASKGTQTATEERQAVQRWYYGHDGKPGAKDSDEQVPGIGYDSVQVLASITGGDRAGARTAVRKAVQSCRFAHAW